MVIGTPGRVGAPVWLTSLGLTVPGRTGTGHVTTLHPQEGVNLVWGTQRRLTSVTVQVITLVISMTVWTIDILIFMYF